MPHKASAFFAVYPLTLIYLVHAGDGSFTLAADAVTVLPVVKPLAVVGVFHICFTARGFAVLDELAPAAAFAVLPITLIGVAVCPGVGSAAVLFTVVPLSFIFFAVRENLLAVALLLAVLKAAVIYFSVREGVFSFGHLIVLPFAVK